MHNFRNALPVAGSNMITAAIQVMYSISFIFPSERPL